MSHAEKQSQVGHNSKMIDQQKDENTKKTVEAFVKLERQKQAINEEQKNLLNDAKKNNGDLKTAIRRAAKKLEMTSEQRQAQKEIELETDRVTKLCKDLPLFKAAA